MIQREVEIVNRLGLHARAAAKLVQAAGSFDCEVTMLKDGREVDAKSILGVLQLGAAQGCSLTVRCNGDDEDDAITSICQLIDSGFDELG